jgi:hypothetical protein
MSWISQDSQRGFETTDDLPAQLRAAEQRIKDLEARVRHLEDRTDRAERWGTKSGLRLSRNSLAGTRFVSQNRPLPRQSGYKSFGILSSWKGLSWRSESRGWEVRRSVGSPWPEGHTQGETRVIHKGSIVFRPIGWWNLRLYQISVDVEQKFFGRDDSHPSQPPPPQSSFRPEAIGC